MTETLRHVVRIGLGAFVLVAGIGHFTNTEEFLGQTPTFLPWRTAIVWCTGVIEITLGVLVITSPRWRQPAGTALAVFLVLVFPGNVYQAIEGTDAFGLDTATERWGRLALQPVLVFLAWWSTRPGPKDAT